MPQFSASPTFCDDLLAGKTALVTGAGKGIGRACALALNAVGANVIAVARTGRDLESLSADATHDIQTWEIDATSDEFLKKVEGLNQLHVLVNNLGGNAPQPFTSLSTETLDWMLAINVKAPFRISQAAVKRMRQSGPRASIINISSQMGHVGSPNRTAYCTAKHAVEGLTKSLAVELAEEGIRVNSVAPTFIETPMTKGMLEQPEFYKFVMDRIPMKKLGSAEDVAQAVVFLASDSAAMITGTSMVIDGGWTAQ